MAAPQRDTTIESALPVASSAGLNTLQNINFNSGSNSCDLPAATTLNGVSISAQGNVTGSGTTGATFSITNSGIYTGVGAFQVIANSATTGVVQLIQANGLTTGTGLSISSSGTITTTGSLVSLTANSATTTNGILNISVTGLTSGAGVTVTGGTSMTSAAALFKADLGAGIAGSGFDVITTGVYTDTTGLFSLTANSATTGNIHVVSGTGLTSGSASLTTGGGANMTSAGIVHSIAMGAATAGAGISVVTTGVYTGTTGISIVTGNSATTGTLSVINGTGLTTGKGLVINGTSATLTTGFYFACNDATGNVFTVGSNGHLTSNLGGGTAPVMTTNATGISATAIVAGSTDVCGSFTTTGTPASGTVLTCTFHKTYTTAPKHVSISPINAAAGGVNTMPILAYTATTFTMTWPAGGVYAATPSYSYAVMA